jgi:hypothetical protein
MNFRALPAQLHQTAEEVVRFFKEERGLRKFKVEEPVDDDDVDYRPTLQVVAQDHEDVWIEVSELPYLASLDSVVLHCVTNSLPVKVYVAFPKGPGSSEYKTNIDAARRKGVGAIEVSNGKCHLIQEALPLSLAGLRCEDHKRFPIRYRAALSTAEATFKNGDPTKGCALIYDEIESLCRALARKIHDKNLWQPRAAGAPAANYDTDSWASIVDLIIHRAQLNLLPPKLTRNLLIRVAAVVDFRNAAGHKPKSRAARRQRDRETRTRFETAVDVLRDFVDSVRPLRI